MMVKKTFTNAGTLLIYLLLTVWCIIILIPIYWMLVTAINPPSYIIHVPPILYPRYPTLENFITIFETAPIDRWALNSVVVSVSVTAGAVIFDSMAAYSYAVLKPKGHMIFFLIILACLMIPDQIRILPLFIFLTNLGWTDSYRALIIPFMGSAFGMFLLRQYMGGISKEYVDAAKIEGCGPFGVYVRIILPLSKPVLAVAVIFFFVGNWNALFWPLILTNSESMRTLPVGLATLRGLYHVNFGNVMAGASVSALPLIILFIALQKHFTKGITVGGLKG